MKGDGMIQSSLRMTFAAAALAVLWAAGPLLPEAAGGAEVEVDLSEGAPTATVPPSPAATVAPTSEPTQAPSPAATAAPTSAPTQAASPAPTPGAADDLKQVRFDSGSKGGDEEGLILIAPGGVSPEDTLESFGIDSPFNWKERGRRPLEAPTSEGEEALELSSPETSELKDRVSVESAQGTELPGEADYDLVERSGGLLGASEYRVDGRLVRAKGGQFFAKKGNLVLLKMEAGRQVYPGTLFTTFQDHGLRRATRGDQRELGALVKPTGVIRVTRLEGEEVQARVEKQYETIREGDLVRLRDPEKQRYYATLRQGPSSVPPELAGEVAAVEPFSFVAAKGSMVYLSIGRAQGLAPGMRLAVHREAQPLDSAGGRSVVDSGRVGLVKVVAVYRYSATAVVLKTSDGLRPGDLVRYR